MYFFLASNLPTALLASIVFKATLPGKFVRLSRVPFGKLLTKLGFHSSGNELLYNGQTGEQMDSAIFIGPTYYMRLKQLVKMLAVIPLYSGVQSLREIAKYGEDVTDYDADNKRKEFAEKYASLKKIITQYMDSKGINEIPINHV